jgi:hypothetical protein
VAGWITTASLVTLFCTRFLVPYLLARTRPMVVGISLVDSPGKRRLELMIVRQRSAKQAIDWIRTRAGQPPLLTPEP